VVTIQAKFDAPLSQGKIANEFRRRLIPRAHRRGIRHADRRSSFNPATLQFFNPAILQSCNPSFSSCRLRRMLSRVMRMLLLAVCLAALAGAAQSAQPAAAASRRHRRSTRTRGCAKLSNGLRVVVSENRAAPVVIVEVMYRSAFVSNRESMPVRT
jgi:hypothetical protein